MEKTLQSQLSNPRNGTEHTIAQLGPWFHNIHLPDGTQTAPDHPLGDFPFRKWEMVKDYIPRDLSGWKVLDIGCNAGFYSFELARRGARVTSIDMDSRYLEQAHWCAGQFGLSDRIEFIQMQVYQLAQMKATFDLVWFMGVLYHLRYPLLGLDIVSRKTRRLLVFQTLTLPSTGQPRLTTDLHLEDLDRIRDDRAWPKMAFIEGRLEADPTNWWLPNDACIRAMLRTCGMDVSARPGEDIYVCKPMPTRTISADDDAELRAATGQA
jgi:tRNA (mo5U34)-methyltransferase